MTFLEAAIEILRNEKDPLHFSEITRRAVERNLLSHVGRDPDAAMRACLNTASRGDGGLLIRAKPGFFGVRPGAELPAPPAPPRPATPPPKVAAPEPPRRAPTPASPPASVVVAPAPAPARVEAAAVAAPASVEEPDDEGEEGEEESGVEGGEGEGEGRGGEGGRRKRRRRGSPSGGRFGVRGEAPPPQVVAVKPSRRGSDPTKRIEVIQRVQNLEFEAPQGSGLDGVTDVAVVMANAMSRLVEERPELRAELELIQRSQAAPPPAVAAAPQSQPSNGPGHARRPPPPQGAIARERERERGYDRDRDRDRDREREREDEERGRRRRRRRRRGRRLEWGEGDASGSAEVGAASLLASAAKVLEAAGPRSLHIRQLAEQLANQGVMGGEISEIERAVTAAILLDTQVQGRRSRFVVRGDSRYQLQGSRLPGAAAAAEEALRAALANASLEAERQLFHWLGSLGPRGLEALVRVYLTREGFSIQGTLPPTKGISRLIAIDPELDEEDPRTLVVVIPRKAAGDPGAWLGELDRSQVANMLVFAMGEVNAELGEARIIGGNELVRWLVTQQIGVDVLKIEVAVLDPAFIESLSGLDT